MISSFEVVVLGGGVVGLSAALAMSQRGYKVALLDAGPLVAHQSSSRVYAINHASQRLFSELGVWASLDARHVSPYRHMHVWDASTTAHIDFDARLVGRDRLGTILLESVLKQALFEQLEVAGVTLYSDTRIGTVQNTSDRMILRDDKTEWHADLMILAEGAASTTRACLNVPLTTWSYHQDALVATMQTEKAHEGTAYQVFQQGESLAFLPLAHPHHVSIVWSASPSQVEDLLAYSETVFSEKVAKTMSYVLGNCQVLGTRHAFPLHMRQAQRYSGARWILMGDAAHTIHPMAGLGLNLGLADLSTWLKLLQNDKDSLVSSRLLEAYHRERRAKAWQTIVLMEGIKMIFSNPSSPVRWLRGVGLRACDRLSLLKRLFIGQADFS